MEKRRCNSALSLGHLEPHNNAYQGARCQIGSSGFCFDSHGIFSELLDHIIQVPGLPSTCSPCSRITYRPSGKSSSRADFRISNSQLAMLSVLHKYLCIFLSAGDLFYIKNQIALAVFTELSRSYAPKSADSSPCSINLLRRPLPTARHTETSQAASTIKVKPANRWPDRWFLSRLRQKKQRTFPDPCTFGPEPSIRT